MHKITITFDGNNIQVKLPDDPVLALGLLEVAKMHVQKNIMGIE